MTDDQKGMVNELLGYDPDGDDGKRLTDWELKFLSDQQGRQGNLTGKQANSLGEIWTKAFAEPTG